MAGKNTAIFGIYPNRTAVESAVDGLKAAGLGMPIFPRCSQRTLALRDFAHEKNTKAPEGATKGAGTGVLLGGGLGWLAGIGALAIPGLGPFIAAGPWWRSRRTYGSFNRHGNSGVRSEAVLRPGKGRWDFAIGALR